MTVCSGPLKVEDRRSHRRELAEREVFVAAKGFSWTCRLVDVTPAGARVAFAGAATWPDEVVLADPAMGTAYRARIAWRTAYDVGLEFIEAGRVSDLLISAGRGP